MEQQTDRQLLQETHDAVIELSAVVLGVKGSGGLVSDMKEIKLSVSEMTLKASKGEADVAGILQDVQNLKPKVNTIDQELHKDNGICENVANHSTQIRNNTRLIWALWTAVGVVATGLLTYSFTHV